MGLLFAFIALLCWGVGDFMIQRSARKIGSWAAMFFIGLMASIILFPFIYKEIADTLIDGNNLFLLFTMSVVMLVASWLFFESLRIGKISVIDPILAMELPVTVILALFILREKINLEQGVLIIIIIGSIFLLSVKQFKNLHKIHLEKGVGLAMLAMAGMGIANFFFGVCARETSPLMVVWFTSGFISIVTIITFIAQKRTHELFLNWCENRKLLLSVGFIDNMAWIAFAYSVLYIPIAIATSISESYVIIAAGLGLYLNKERLKKHQIIGLGACVIAVIFLAIITQ
ncbi:MAG: DMT family transporter [Patescibacteria group bacterium]